jgi:hypothetical protein
MEDALIIETWDTFKDYIAEKNRETAASHYVDFLLGKDVELSELESVMGYDPHLDSAIKLVLDAERQEEVDDSDDWNSDEEAEDY